MRRGDGRAFGCLGGASLLAGIPLLSYGIKTVISASGGEDSFQVVVGILCIVLGLLALAVFLVAFYGMRMQE